jgi:hypothetical protein
MDVLRGLAIVGMVLSGTISRNGQLPAWLYHAQIAPPEFVFNPQLPGITWVDLVFPFFLFAMGASFPFSLGKALENGQSKRKLTGRIGSRTFKLLFFAIMLGHLSPFHYPQELGWIRYLLGMLAFLGFFLAFSKFGRFPAYEKWINLGGYLALGALLIVRVTIFDLPFSIHKNDIIILVLANMALFGGLLWLFTSGKILLRLAIVALYFAFRITYSTDESVNQAIWNFTPFSWLAMQLPDFYQQLLTWGFDLKKTIFYNPDYLKYLMIVVPGSIVGEFLVNSRKSKVDSQQSKVDSQFEVQVQRSEVRSGKLGTNGWVGKLLPVLLFLNISLNLWGLLSRQLELVWIMNIITVLFMMWFAGSDYMNDKPAWRQVLLWSSFWLILGLIFEAWQGGIKKDPATYSYFFLTSGLAGYAIVIFKWWEKAFRPGMPLGWTAATGNNPMVGYVAASYLIMPLLYFAQLLPWMDQWHTHWAWAGVLRGVILTTLMVLVTVYSVKRKWLWKT